MEYENQNNPLDWKGKLEGLESLPGEALPDRNASWERLYRRIEIKKRPGRYLWYRLAAAVVVLVLLIPLFFTLTRPRPVARPHTNPGNTPSVYADAPEDHADPMKMPQRDSPKNSVAVVSRTVTARRKQSSPAIRYGVPTYDSGKVSPAVVKTARVFDTPPDTTALIVSAPPVSKKLKVVHVNELGDPVWPPAEMAHSGDTHSFQMQLGRQEIYSNPPVSFNKHLIQIKITTSN